MPPLQHDQGSFTNTDDERALDSRYRFERDSINKAMGPIEYRVLYVKDGVEHVITFKCLRDEKSTHLRQQFGINLDNVPHALQSKYDGRWGKPIGDKNLVPKLEKHR